MMHALLLITIPVQRNDIPGISVRYLTKWTILPLLDFLCRCLVLTLKCIGYLYVFIFPIPVTGNKITFKITDSSVAYLIALASQIDIDKIFQGRAIVQTVIRIGTEIVLQLS